MKAMKMTTTEIKQTRVRGAVRVNKPLLFSLCFLAFFTLLTSTVLADPIFVGSAKDNPNVDVVLSFIDIAWNKHKAQEGFSKYWTPDAFIIRGGPATRIPSQLINFSRPSRISITT